MVAGEATEVEIDGQRVRLTNLDKILYPETETSKAEVIRYYAAIAPTLLTHIGDRAMTFRRFPNGVHESSFFGKRAPDHRPDWINTATGPGDSGGGIDYCLLDTAPAIVWAANLAALELHAPMARAVDIEAPTMVVFDLDPGEGAGMTECAQVGLDINDTLGSIGFELFAKTSGSKGLQLYLPLNTPHTHDHAKGFAQALAQLMEKNHRDRITSVMTKSDRVNKVLIDWSQNSRHKTTIGVYSMRARPAPTVSTPVTWDEVADAADGEPLSFDIDDVLERVEDLGDLFAPTAVMEQELPTG